jgi:hypothetical protein
VSAGREGSSTGFRLVVASLIAVTSLLGAVSAWRAETASSKGEEAERKAFADRVAGEQAKTTIRQDIENAVYDYEQAQSYFSQARALREEAAKAPAPEARRVRTQASAQQRLGKLVLGYVDADALRPDGKLDLGHYYDVNYAQVQSGQDVDPLPEFAEADRLTMKSERLVGLTALLVAAAFFFTLGQVSKRWGPKRLFLGGGLLVLVSSTVLLVLVELGT